MVANSKNVGAVGRGDSDEQSLDVVFDVLANQRRRYALARLTEHAQPITLADLAEDVADRENEGPMTEVSNEEVQTIRTALYHNHIPKLEDAGAVEYDRDRNLVLLSETTDMPEYMPGAD